MVYDETLNLIRQLRDVFDEVLFDDDPLVIKSTPHNKKFTIYAVKAVYDDIIATLEDGIYTSIARNEILAVHTIYQRLKLIENARIKNRPASN
jgi:hypothetical protein